MPLDVAMIQASNTRCTARGIRGGVELGCTQSRIIMLENFIGIGREEGIFQNLRFHSNFRGSEPSKSDSSTPKIIDFVENFETKI